MNARCQGESARYALGEVPVLMYHSIADEATTKFRRFTVNPSEFAAQMDYLHDQGYQPITGAELASGRSGHGLPARPVVLTFDDAFADFHSTALPVLQKHSFRASLYVPTAYVGTTMSFLGSVGEEDRVALSWQALREIAAAGIEIAAHSHTHPQMDRVPAAVVTDETRRCRHSLEDNLGSTVAGFAYPFGYWNRAARTAVAAAGFRYAFAVDDLMTTTSYDVLTLPRLTVNAGIGVPGLARLLEAHSTLRSRNTATAKRIVWRVMRQMVPVLGGDPREGGAQRDGG